jgi:hypothetical protein
MLRLHVRRCLPLVILAVLFCAAGCPQQAKETPKGDAKESAKPPATPKTAESTQSQNPSNSEKGPAMSYGKALAFLGKHTQVVELSSGDARVAVTPAWQGRVMTSTCGGNDGPSFGFVHDSFIEAGKINPQFNNYGAEERLWLCPEGGQFSLWFKPGEMQEMKNWYTPKALNEGEWKAGKTTDSSVVMNANLKFKNASDTAFDLDVERTVQLLSGDEFGRLFGAAAAKLVKDSGAKMVAYATDNKITNLGPDFVKEKGLVSIWILGMMNASPKSVIIMPYKPGDTAELGPVVKSDYFGAVPPERLKITPEAVLLSADSHFRTKIGASQRRAKSALGSMDFAANVLTLVNFNMPADPTKEIYLNNMWQVPQEKPFVGDVVNAYNDGPNDLGSQLGAFYEIESVSPAKVLKTGESLLHSHRTVHIQSDYATLKKIAQEVLGVDLDAVKKAMP